MTVIEGNKLIKDFIKDDPSISHLRGFNRDWNALMPVVEKIQSLGFKFIIGDRNRVTVYNKDYDWRNGHTTDSIIECVWHGVVQFIIWYNSTLTNKTIK